MSSSQNPRGSYAGTAAFRARVLDVALQTLARRGFDATTLQLIADEVGRSKAGLLHHFGSREELFLAVVRHRDDVNRELFPAAADGDLSSPVALAAHNATVPGLVALFVMGAALAGTDTDETERRRYFVERYARVRSAYAREIARAQQIGVIRPDIDPETAATLIIATMDGLQTQWLLDPSVDMAHHVSTMIALLHNDAGARPELRQKRVERAGRGRERAVGSDASEDRGLQTY